MTEAKKQNDINILQVNKGRLAENEARWLKSKRSSTEQSILDAARQPNEKKK